MAVRYASHVFVCFDCRTTHKGWVNCMDIPPRRCQHCGWSMIRLGYKIRVPKKKNNKAWKKLEKRFAWLWSIRDAERKE